MILCYYQRIWYLRSFTVRCVIRILSSITNKMQRYTIFFIAVNSLHVSVGFSAHHQELKTVHTASGICQACLLLPVAWVSWQCQASGSSNKEYCITLPLVGYTWKNKLMMHGPMNVKNVIITCIQFLSVNIVLGILIQEWFGINNLLLQTCPHNFRFLF